MKHTAVEWLIEQLKSRSIDLNKWNSDLVNQAKEMEKKQIIDAYTHDRVLLQITAEHYYNETFKSK